MKSEHQHPTEEEITELLSQIQPTPRVEFNHKMADQPWNRGVSTPIWARFTPIRAAATIGLVLILILGIGFFSPSLETVAQHLTRFFAPYASDRITAEIEPQETDDPHARFNQSIEQAEALADFTMKLPESLPEEFVLTGAVYDDLRKAIILNYITESGELVLRISQRRLGPDYQGIGPQAVVEIVQIGPYKGEYVSGGWVIPEVKSGVDATKNPATSEAIWDEKVNLQTLRWTDDEHLYEIVLAGSTTQPPYLDKDALIRLAINMQ